MIHAQSSSPDVNICPGSEKISDSELSSPALATAPGRFSWRPLLACALFAIGLLGGLTFLHFCLPAALSGDEIGRKLAHFRQISPEIDTLFLGSSRVYTHISPSVFDRTTAEAGVPTHSFNFGATGLVPPETDFVFRQIMETHPPKLRRLIVELLPTGPQIAPLFAGTARSVYWHDIPTTLESIELSYACARGKKGSLVYLANVVSLSAQHIGLFLQNLAGLGAADVWLEKYRHPEAEASKLKESLGPDGDGFIPLKKTLQSKDLQAYANGLAQLRKQQGVSLPQSQIAAFQPDRNLIEQWIALTKSAGIDLIFYVAPNINNATPPGLIATARSMGITVWNFDDPNQYPALFVTDHRADLVHLNAAGAKILTQYLAGQLAAHVKSTR